MIDMSGESRQSNRTAVFRGPFALEFEEEALPDALQANEALIRTECTLISPGTELALYTGTHVGLQDPGNRFAKYPFYPGYALAGVVVATGADVRSVAPGDRVYTIGRHARYHVAREGEAGRPLIKLKQGTASEHALFARLAAICMTSVVQTEIRLGAWTVVYGMGLIGNLAAQLYALQGAEVVAVDVVAERLGIAAACGIPHTLLSGSREETDRRMRDIVGAEKPDIVVEATGSPALVVPALDAVKPLGQVIALGSTRGNVDVNVYEYIHRRGARYIGAHEGLQNIAGFPDRATITRYIMRLIELEALKVAPLLTHRLAPEEARQGYELLLKQQSQALGIVLDWR